MVESVAAVLLCNNQVLVAQKEPSHKLAGLWEFPGGKLETDETSMEALKREMLEELSITIDTATPLKDYCYELPQYRLHIQVYVVETWSGLIDLTEHAECRFVTKVELEGLPFVPSDFPAREMVISHILK